MRGVPTRYAARRYLGWRVYRNWTPIADHVIAHVDTAKKVCESNAQAVLDWTEQPKSTPEGHSSYSGQNLHRNPNELSKTWQISPDYERVRERIPLADFISPDERCLYFVQPNGNRWELSIQYDLEGADPGAMMIAGIIDSPDFAGDAARIWHIHQAYADTKEAAIKHGYYLWGRDLVQRGTPPPAAGPWATRLRNLAKKFI